MGRRKDSTLISLNPGFRDELHEKKYVWISAKQFAVGPELAASRQRLWKEWDHLEPDHYLKDGAHFRLRRFCACTHKQKTNWNAKRI